MSLQPNRAPVHLLLIVTLFLPTTSSKHAQILFGEWDPTQDDRVQLCRTVLDAINRHLKPGPDRAALMRRHGATLRSQPASTKPPGRSAPQPARSTTSAATAATAAAAATGDFDENAGIVDDDFLMDYREGGGDDLEGGGDD